MSPGVPALIGVAMPTVYFLETVESPWRNKLLASIPLAAVEVTLLVKTTGPVNSEITFPSSPPSTRIDDEKVASVALTRLIPDLVEMSSPVILLIGVSKISSLPVTVLSFLLPA